jgi:hypothetical protein
MAYINSEMDYKAVYVKRVRVLVFYAGCYDTLRICVCPIIWIQMHALFY